MIGVCWRRTSLRAMVGLSALLSNACEHGLPAVEHGTLLADSQIHQAAENSDASAVAGAVIGVSYTVRINDGRVVTVVQHLNPNEAVMPLGSRVRITTEGQLQRVTSDPI